MINRPQLLSKANIYLPEENLLSEKDMAAVLDDVIVFQVKSDEESDFGQALCLFLQSVGEINKSKYSTFSHGLKRDKANGGELEYHDSNRAIKAWEDFLNNLPNICRLFGHSLGRLSFGISITPGEATEVNPYCTAFNGRSNFRVRRGSDFGDY